MAIHSSPRKRPVFKMALMGIFSVALYAVLLAKQDLVSDYFTRGGIFAFLPIAAAFLFSLIHGSFTGHFWTVLGIEAKKKKTEGK